MEQNNLENEIREQLRKREIQPSIPAWDRLDAMLTYQESSLEKKVFPWRRIAAVLVLFLGVGYFFLNSNKKIGTKQDVIVVGTEQIVKSEEQQVGKTDTLNLNSSSKSLKKEKLPMLVTDNSRNIKQYANNQNVSGENNKSTKDVVSEVVGKQIAVVGVVKENSTEVTNIEVQNTQATSVAVSDLKMFEKPKLKVDPSALLKQVDGEIQLTFRQKVMKTITKGYKEAKEAVATRNQESSINY